MGLSHKEDYQEYLKSEHWMALRNSVIEQLEGRCSICASQSALNDVHHIYYCGNWLATKAHHLTVLCRNCHDNVHAMMVGDEPKNAAAHFKRWFKIRDELRAQIPGLMAKLNADRKLWRLINVRPQPVSVLYKRSTVTKRIALMGMLRNIAPDDVEKLLHAARRLGIGNSKKS